MLTPTQSLQAELDKYKRLSLIAYEGIISIRDYLEHSKFHNEPMVQFSDIQLRLSELRSDLINAELEPYGFSCSIRRDGTHWQTDRCNHTYGRLTK